MRKVRQIPIRNYSLKSIHIISGGTISYVRPHFALCAPAWGTTGRDLQQLCDSKFYNRTHHDNGLPFISRLHLTKMAGDPNGPATNEDVSNLIDELVENPETGVIFMPVALCDFEVTAIGNDAKMYTEAVGKEHPRLKTSEGNVILECSPADKLIGKIRKERKDIFLVGFKTTTGASKNEMFNAGMNLLKKSSCNLVLVNDLESRTNMIVTPELARYGVTKNRNQALWTLVNMAHARSQLTFHRTNVVNNLQLIKWDSHRIPDVLRQVVDYCVERGAYRAFNDVTVGHFGVFQNARAIMQEIHNDMMQKELSEGDQSAVIAAAISHGGYQSGIPVELPGQSTIYSSRRKKNYNNPEDKDLVVVTFDKDGNPTAYGDKPSAGVRSQYEVFKANPEFDCVVHFHCKLKDGSSVNVRPQQHLECGSLECGMNTRDGMRQHGEDIRAVMLDKHGPNVLFKRDADPQKVIDFIEANFDLDSPTSDL